MSIKKFICCLVCFFAFSCASTLPPREGTPQREVISPEVKIKEIETSRQMQSMNEKILMSSLSSKRGPSGDYHIGPEDLVEISVFEDEKLNKTVRVSSQGNISLPLVGILRVKGLTANELEKEIRDLLAEKYFQDPHVTVFIKEYRNQRISVIGAVEKPGSYDITGQRTVLDMLAMAGGLKGSREEEAGHLLFLIRPPESAEPFGGKKETDQSKTRTFVINLEDLLVKGDLSLNMLVAHGDVINVPVSGKIFVGGEVRSPGGFQLKGKKMTVGHAVTLAGGITIEADGAGTKLIRYTGDGNEKEIITVDVNAIQKGQGEDLYLRENDILIVPKSDVKSFLIGLRETVKGLLGFGFSFGAL
jgi:polysaccharide export outer membrane protein